MSQVDVDIDAVDEWVVCLGCYATREPMDPDRDCACWNGYTAEPGMGILDSEHVMEWRRASEFTPEERRLTFGPGV